MNLESIIAQEDELREELTELDQRIREVGDRLREAKDGGDALAFTDANEELANLQEERDRLRKALRLAGEERLRAQTKARASKAKAEVDAIRAELAGIYGGAFAGINELKAALDQFDTGGFKTAAMKRIQAGAPLVKRLRAYQVAYRAPWEWGEVMDLVKRVSAVQALLTKFGG